MQLKKILFPPPGSEWIWRRAMAVFPGMCGVQNKADENIQIFITGIQLFPLPAARNIVADVPATHRLDCNSKMHPSLRIMLLLYYIIIIMYTSFLDYLFCISYFGSIAKDQ